MPQRELITPKCLYCGRELNPVYVTIYDDDPNLQMYKQPKYKIRILGYGHKGNNLFCSHSHGFAAMVKLFNDGGLLKVFQISKPAKVERDQLIIAANKDRGFEADGTMSVQDLTIIYNQLASKTAIEFQDSVSWKKIKGVV